MNSFDGIIVKVLYLNYSKLVIMVIGNGFEQINP
jgi:hypothetical protein